MAVRCSGVVTAVAVQRAGQVVDPHVLSGGWGSGMAVLLGCCCVTASRDALPGGQSAAACRVRARLAGRVPALCSQRGRGAAREGLPAFLARGVALRHPWRLGRDHSVHLALGLLGRGSDTVGGARARRRSRARAVRPAPGDLRGTRCERHPSVRACEQIPQRRPVRPPFGRTAVHSQALSRTLRGWFRNTPETCLLPAAEHRPDRLDDHYSPGS